MPSYSTAAKVQTYFRDIDFSLANAALTTAEVEAFMDDIESLLKAKLSYYYDITTIGAESTIILGRIVDFKSVAMIQTVLGVGDDDNAKVPINFNDEAQMMMAGILPTYNKKTNRYEDPKLPLPDTTLAGKGPAAGALFSGKQVSDPTFTKGGDNW